MQSTLRGGERTQRACRADRGQWVGSSDYCFFFSSRRRHTRCSRDWSSDVCSSDLIFHLDGAGGRTRGAGRKEFDKRRFPLRPTWGAGDPTESFLQRVVVESERSSGSVQAVLPSQFHRGTPQGLWNG